MSDEILAWIHFTREIERSGFKFYEECLKHSKDQRSEELFKYLIDEEKKHEERMTALLEKKSEGDKSRVDAAIEKFNKTGMESPMFKKDDLDMVKDPNALVMEMFNRSAEQEKKGIDLYLDLEKTQEDPEVKQFFHDLATEELLHKKKIIGLGMSLMGMEEEDEDTSKEALEKELQEQKTILHEVALEIKECAFIPQEIRVKKGETVVLKIKTDYPAGLRMINFQVDEYLSPGKDIEVTFKADTAGEFNFYSHVPCRLGNDKMKGMLIIEGENEPDEEL